MHTAFSAPPDGGAFCHMLKVDYRVSGNFPLCMEEHPVDFYFRIKQHSFSMEIKS